MKKRKSFKDYIVEKTEREGPVYLLLETVLMYFLTTLNLIKRGHFIRKKRINEYLKNNDIVKLQFGSHSSQMPGYLNTDLFWNTPVDITKKLPFNDSSVDVIYSSHTCEHIYRRQFVKFLADCHRILKKGGINIIAMPSLEKICRTMYGNDEKSKNVIKDYHLNVSKCRDKIVCGANYINDTCHIMHGHRYLYDLEYLQYLGKEAGYTKVYKVENDQTPEKHINEKAKDSGDFWECTTETFIMEK